MTVLTAGNDRLFSVRVDTRVLDRAARDYPRVTYFWLRNWLGQSFGRHRQQWLRRKGIKFGRGGAASRAIQAPPVNEGPASPPDNFVTWRVTPEEPRFRSPRQARRALDELNAFAQTGSLALEVHEFGKTIRSNRLMAIPIRTRPGTPSEWRARFPQKTLITVRTRRGGLILYERQRKRGGARRRQRRTKSGRVAKSQPRVKVDVLRPRFLLLRRVQMRPTLEFYATWDSLSGQRTAAFKRAADRIVRDIARGVDS